MAPRPDPSRRPAPGSLFRAGAGLRLAAALGLSSLLWAVIVWAGR